MVGHPTLPAISVTCSIEDTFSCTVRVSLSEQAPYLGSDETLKIKVLLADDSDVMRSAIRRTLQEEPRIEVVGEASSFAKTMQMIADCKPDVLLLDLHLAEKRDFAPSFVRSQLVGVRNVVAVSFSTDDEAQALARSYGASALLDKMNLYNDMIPTILQCSVATASPKSWAASA